MVGRETGACAPRRRDAGGADGRRDRGKHGGPNRRTARTDASKAPAAFEPHGNRPLWPLIVPRGDRCVGGSTDSVTSQFNLAHCDTRAKGVLSASRPHPRPIVAIGACRRSGILSAAKDTRRPRAVLREALGRLLPHSSPSRPLDHQLILNSSARRSGAAGCDAQIRVDCSDSALPRSCFSAVRPARTSRPGDPRIARSSCRREPPPAH